MINLKEIQKLFQNINYIFKKKKEKQNKNLTN